MSPLLLIVCLLFAPNAYGMRRLGRKNLFATFNIALVCPPEDGQFSYNLVLKEIDQIRDNTIFSLEGSGQGSIEIYREESINGDEPLSGFYDFQAELFGKCEAHNYKITHKFPGVRVGEIKYSFNEVITLVNN